MSQHSEDSNESSSYFFKHDADGELMDFEASVQSSEDRYKIVGEVGKGGQGRVFSCQDTTLGRTVALKEPKEVRGWSRLQREVMIAAKLSHPNIVPVYDITTVDGKPCSVMKLVGNQTLTEAIEEYHQSTVKSRLGSGEASPSDTEKSPARTLVDLLRILKETCNAIAYAHSQKVLHRDLKPQNISLGEYGETIVLDWGLACSIDDIQGSQFSHQSGSPGYCSPEQMLGDSSKIGYATDIYSLGAILFKILTNTTVLEVQRASDMEGARDVRTISPRLLQPTVPADLDAICCKALQWEPGDRYASVTDLARDLDRFAQDLPVSVRKPNWKDKLRRFSKVHYAGLLSTATAALIAAIAAGVIISLVLIKDKQINAANDDMATALTVADNTLRGLEGQGVSYYLLADAATGRLEKDGQVIAIDASLPLYKGLLMLKDRKSEDAIPLLRDAVASDPSRGSALFFLSLALANIQNYEESVSIGTKLAENEPGNVYSQQHLADMYHSLATSQNDNAKRLAFLKQGEDYAQRAYALDRDYHLTLGTLGQIKLELGELDEAYEFIKKAVGVNPDSSNKRKLVEVLRAQGRDKEAYEVSQELAEVPTENRHDILVHARILRALGRFEQAIDYFKRFDEMQSQLPKVKQTTASHYNDWALALVSQRKFADSLEIFERGRPSLTGNPIFEGNVALAVLGLGNKTEAVSRLRKVLESDQSPSTVCYMLQSLMVSDEFEQVIDFDSAIPIFDSGSEMKCIFVRSALAYIACRLADRPLTPAAKQWEEFSQSPAIEKETWDYYYLEQWLSKLPDSQRGEAEATIQKLSSIVAPRYPVAK